MLVDQKRSVDLMSEKSSSGGTAIDDRQGFGNGLQDEFEAVINSESVVHKLGRGSGVDHTGGAGISVDLAVQHKRCFSSKVSIDRTRGQRMTNWDERERS